MGLLPLWRLYIYLFFSSFSLAHKTHYKCLYCVYTVTCYVKWYILHNMLYIFHVCACTWVCISIYIYMHTCTHSGSTLQLIFCLYRFPSDKKRISLQCFPNCFLNAQAVWAQADKEWEHSRETSPWMSTGFGHEGKKRSSSDVMDSAPRKLWINANWWSKTLTLIERKML